MSSFAFHHQFNYIFYRIYDLYTIMPANINPRRKAKEKYTFLLIPNKESKKQRSVVIGKIGIFFIVIVLIGSISFITVGLLVFTPLGNFLPIDNPELENKYGKQIIAVQEKLNILLEEIVSLRQYNLQLRKVLGEKIIESDTVSVPNNLAPAIETELAEKKPALSADKFESYDLTNENFLPARNFQEMDILQPEFPLVKPVLGFQTRGYNPEEGHFGIDISGKESSPVLAAAAGTVIFSDWSYDYGFMIVISHGEGFVTIYKHNQKLLKSEGEPVKRSEPIALLGNTGKKSTGPHLHFEVWKNGFALDPNEFIIN